MFAIYKLENGNEPKEYIFLRKITNERGARTIPMVLCERVDAEVRKGRPLDNEMLGWEITGKELLSGLSKEQERAEEGNYKLIIDAMPRNVGSDKPAQLFEICHIFGDSYKGWTPLLLRLVCVFDRTRASVEQTRFPSETECHSADDFVHEFVYLSSGYGSAAKPPKQRRKDGERRNWGGVGFTNGALLRPIQLTHLLSKIGFKRAL